jgi:DNA invertase Pin-like site-specific DNA recombinase
MTRPTTIRAAIYTRISSDAGAGALGVARQEKDCRALCRDRGWQVIQPVYCDNDVTAADRKKVRPAYQRLLADIRAGKVDAVAVYDLDRLARQPDELGAFVVLCETMNVTELATVAGTIDVGTGDGLLVARIKAAVAEEEVRKTRQRIQRKNLELAEKGEPNPGGRRAFGWVRTECVRNGTVVDEAEAELIREAARQFLAGESLRSIREDWRQRGIRGANPLWMVEFVEHDECVQRQVHLGIGGQQLGRKR